MSSPVEISDDDDSFEEPQASKRPTRACTKPPIELSSDNDSDKTVEYRDDDLTSDEEYDLPKVNITSKKTSAIKNLFPASTKQKKIPDYKKVPNKSVQPNIAIEKPLKAPGFDKMIGGVKVNMPVEPYGSQMALMAKVITSINKGQNCLLESPTGSGKTLALLCAALAWQHNQKTCLSTQLAQQYFKENPQLSSVSNATERIATPVKKNNLDYVFNKPNFGEKSIYDKPAGSGDPSGSGVKRQEPLSDSFEDTNNGLVTIHKKRRLDDFDGATSSKTSSPEYPCTPEKTTSPEKPETPEQISIPTIYYGARTHKQLQQVIKEFKRTWYCGEATMTILASREYACIREFDKQYWSTKNDMCRGCTKTHVSMDESKPKEKTNCKYYDNRQALNHGSLPPAFDLEELVSAGEGLLACPYYGARGMAAAANIVFCPYNYLIEPGIRSSMQIDIRDKILIIDEAHNIEDICRDAATQTITRDQIQSAIKELDVLTGYRYKNQDIMNYIERLLKAFRNWDDWFNNQLPLVDSKPVNNNEAVHTWEVEHFVQTLNNHNIGQQQFSEFSESADAFSKRLREDPRTLFGVSQATGNLVESLQTVLGFLFRQSMQCLEDFKPALVKTVAGNTDSMPDRMSQYNQWVSKESLALRLICLNPGVVFEGLRAARCILLASGTLTPMTSLHSELATEFPLRVSPNHVIPRDRVWIGTLTRCADGTPLECTSRGASRTHTQDALGAAVLRVTRVTPHGVLCFTPSYHFMNTLAARWRETGLWAQLSQTKRVFMESRIVRDHNDIMDEYYKCSVSERGALLLAVYRGKVSEGMDFKDRQARAVITIGVPYPNTFDMAVKEKMKYNDKFAHKKNLLSSGEWLRVQAYRALNQAVGRCVRHRGDWGAVLLVDSRFNQPYYTEHLSKWVLNFLGNNHHTYGSLVDGENSLESFMQNMTIRDEEDAH